MDILQQLYNVVYSRKSAPMEGSYTCYLFDAGIDKILKKVGEETAETIIAAKNDQPEPLVGEISDLLYHLMVLCAQKDIPWQAVADELAARTQKLGNLKPMRQTDKET